MAVLVDWDQKSVYSLEEGNRELVTVIETICADGSSLHPSAIFRGQRLMSAWGKDNPCGARYVQF